MTNNADTVVINADSRSPSPQNGDDIGTVVDSFQSFSVSDSRATISENIPAPKPTRAEPGKKKTVEEIYQKKTQLEHILLRPDTYIGSVEAECSDLWVYDRDTDSMAFRTVKVVPGLYKIVDEILVNAADNKVRRESIWFV